MNNRRPFLAGFGVGFFIASVSIGLLILTGKLNADWIYFGALFMVIAVGAHLASK